MIQDRAVQPLPSSILNFDPGLIHSPLSLRLIPYRSAIR